MIDSWGDSTWVTYNADCMDILPLIPSQSVGMIFADLPYGRTLAEWDTVLPIQALWAEYKRVIKPKGAIVLTATQPFASALVMSNPAQFKYAWIWDKLIPSGYQIVKYRPMQQHEEVLVFCDGTPTYYPIKTLRDKPIKSGGRNVNSVSNPMGRGKESKDMAMTQKIYYDKNPTSILQFKREKGLHPTQKPVALVEYMIRTYTEPQELILDNTMGSGTTIIAAIRTGRQGIGVEMNEAYYQTAVRRINRELDKTP